jgi:sulfite oxidase
MLTPAHGKGRGFRALSADPFNGGPALDRLASRVVTPERLFFVRCHGNIPHIDRQDYALTVGGLVHRPLRVTLKDLKKRFAARKVEAVLQCAGSRRKELRAVDPIPGELAWGPEAVSNGVWGGVSLSDVLWAARPTKAARHASFVGLDQAHTADGKTPFGGSIPLSKAMAHEVLLAFTLNGRPLSPAHGFPLRVVVPGYIGARSVKWLGRIELTATPSDNYFQQRAYKLLPRHATAAATKRARPLSETVLNSVICSPEPGAVLQGSPLRVRGYAVGPGGHKVGRVQVSTDGGKSWRAAQQLGKSSKWGWRLWSATLPVPAGRLDLVVRAFDTQGRVQPSTLRQVWNAKGYVNNAWHRIHVTCVGVKR